MGGELRGVSEKQNHLAGGLAGLLGCALIGVAMFVDRHWLEGHVLPEFFQPREEQFQDLATVRIACAVGGGLLVWPVRRALTRVGFRDLWPYLLAVVLAVGASELLLQRMRWFSAHERSTQVEPIRHSHPRFGWTYLPDRVGYGVLGGRRIEYAFDAGGHRVRRPGDALDYAAPSIVFLGESIIAGHGVTFDESSPARVAGRLGLQPANLAVGGYATDQMHMRFRDEWPRFRQPRAVVILFMPLLFHRNLDADRPHLAPGLVWRPATQEPRLVQIARRIVPYRTDAEINAAALMTRQALADVVRSARTRGATPVILVPQLTPETAEEARLRMRILKGLPVLHVTVDPAWRIPGNRHPDARADAKLADAVVRYLQDQGVQAPAPPFQPAP